MDARVAGEPIDLAETGGYFTGVAGDWGAGDAVSFAATGGTFPSFDPDDLVLLPEPLALVARPVTVDPTQDLELTWEDPTGAPSGSASTPRPADALASFAAGGAEVSMARSAEGYDTLPGDYLVYAYAQHTVSWQARSE